MVNNLVGVLLLVFIVLIALPSEHASTSALPDSNLIAMNPLPFSFQFCEENVIFPDTCMIMIRDILGVLHDTEGLNIGNANGEDSGDDDMHQYLVMPHFVLPLRVEDGGSEYSLTVFYTQRLEDAVDDMELVYSSVLQPDHNPPFSTNDRRDLTLSALCDQQSSYMTCDGSPPREIIGIWTFLDLDYNFRSDDADGEDSTYFYRYNIRDGYDMHFHILYICSLLSYSNLQCQAKSGYIKEHIEKEIILFKKYEDSDKNSVGISIGHDCGAALIGTRYNFRKRKKDGYLTGPFDLIVSNYDGVIQCLEDDFKYFLDTKYLKVIEVGKSVDDYDFPIHNSDMRKGDKVLINTRYRFCYIHESPSTFDKLERIKTYFGSQHGDSSEVDSTIHWPEGPHTFTINGFKRFKARYQKRIDNFRGYMNSGKLINFLLHNMFNPHAFPRLDIAMKKAYPLTDYRVTVLPAHIVKYSELIYWNDILNISTIVVEF